jgi:hypothetical protein
MRGWRVNESSGQQVSDSAGQRVSIGSATRRVGQQRKDSRVVRGEADFALGAWLGGQKYVNLVLECG